VIERPFDSSSLFSGLRAKERLLLSTTMEVQKFSQGEEIFAQGALSETLYLIESGWVRLTREEKGERVTMATLGPGDLLGEEEFLLDRPYSVGAEATSEVTAWKLAKADLLAVVRKEPQIGVKLSIALGSPVAGVAEYLAEHRLAKTSLFSSLPTDLLLDIAERLRPKGYERGEKICQAGDLGEAIYIVESGRIEALPGVEGEEVRSLGEGGLFGEMAVLTGRGHGATYRAATQVTLWVLSREEFGRLAQAHPLLRRVAGEHGRAKVFGLPVAAERIKAAAARIRLSLAARLLSLGQGVRMLVAAFRDLLKWQAHQRRAVRVQLGVVVLLLIWLCGVSAPTAVISSMTGGEGMVALLAAPTPTFTPSPMPTDTPTLSPPTPTSTATLIPLPTDTPTPPPLTPTPLPPTPSPTEVPTDTPTPEPTATPGTAPTSTPTPKPPTATPTSVPPPQIVTRVFDWQGNEKDMNWAWEKYGVRIDRAPLGPAYRAVELRERVWTWCGNDVTVLNEAGEPMAGVLVRKSWSGGFVEEPTESSGKRGFGAGGGDCHGGRKGTQSGPYSFEIVDVIPSDIGRGFGWICLTNHDHMDIVFQLVR